MTKYVDRGSVRSQMFALFYRAVRHGEMTKKYADRQFNYVHALRIRLLGDRVPQNVAWKIADQLGWPGHPRRRVRRPDPAPS